MSLRSPSGATFFRFPRAKKRCTLGAVALLVALTMPPSAAAAFEPIGLRVDGGEETWHAESSFAVRWENPPGVAAVHFRLLDPTGKAVLAEARIGWGATSIQHLAVPPTPGAYTAEIWLEDGLGVEGPPASATLRFDDEAPQAVAPVEPSGWLGRPDFPLALHIGHPDEPLPFSGIRGYAVSIDRDPSGAPCDGATCDAGETDLQGGIDADAFDVGGLPEGVSLAHAVAVSGSGVPSPVVGTVELRVDATDPVTRLSGAPAGWSHRPLTLVATATDDGSGMTQSEGDPVPYTAIRIDGGAPAVASGDRVTATAIESGVHTVAFYARDAAGNADDGGLANGQRNQAPQTALVRIDREPPAVWFSNSQDPAEPERIDARIADPLSGVDPASGRIAVRPAGSGARYEPLPTSVSGATLSALWDSQSLPPGEYEFRATVADLAGNVAATTVRADGAPMRLPNPLKVVTRLDAALARGTHRTAGCRQSVVFAGRLTAGRRAPVVGGAIEVVERFAPGSDRRERVSTIRTGADGGFHLRLRPGPSREVSAQARPTATLQGSRSSVSPMPVRACVTLHVSARVAKVGGRPIVFRGRVRHVGAKLPAEGVPVQLQFRLPGLSWSEFRTVQTDRRGAFRLPYRFADDDSRGVRFRFRAFVAARAGWAFAPAGSSPVEVLGR
jgi:hypothetical protein